MFNWIDKLILPDKRLHFIAGVLIASVSLAGGWLCSVIALFSIALAKEIYDFFSKKGTPDFFDFLWTLIGGFFPILVYILKGTQGLWRFHIYFL
jgi:hypothetical protein